MSSLVNSNWPVDIEKIDRRNICDHYKYWQMDAILADQDKNRCKLTIFAENFGNDFNVATVVRSSNAFLCKEVVLIGSRKWDRRGAVGMQNYEHLTFATDVHEALKSRGNNRIVVLDNIPGAQNIYDYSWHESTILILGQESIGVSPESLKIAHDVVYIPQFGAVRSLNVGAAATVAMSHYRMQWR